MERRKGRYKRELEMERENRGGRAEEVNREDEGTVKDGEGKWLWKKEKILIYNGIAPSCALQTPLSSPQRGQRSGSDTVHRNQNQC